MIQARHRIIQYSPLFIIILILLFPMGIAITLENSQEYEANDEKLSQAKKTKDVICEPIELISMRTATSKTFDNGNGNYKTVLYVNPIHYVDLYGNWHEIENSKTPLPQESSRAVELDSFETSGDAVICGQAYYPGAGSPDKESNTGNDNNLFLALEDTYKFKRFRVLIIFDLSSLPDILEIYSANIRLDYFYSIQDTVGGNPIEGGQNEPLTIVANPLTQEWVEGTGTGANPSSNGATWYTYDGTNDWTLEGGDYLHKPSGSGATPTSGYGFTSINIEDIVTAWIKGTPNYGVLLRGISGNDLLKIFHSSEFGTVSRRPKLEIEYKYNQAPVINKPISVFRLDEDSSPKYLNLDGISEPSSGIFTDTDSGDVLTFYISGGNGWNGFKDGGALETSNFTAKIQQNGTLEIKPNLNKYGYDDIKLKAKDKWGASIIYGITIIIDPVNDLPKINNTLYWTYSTPEPIYSKHRLICKEDQWANFTVTAYDPIEPEDNQNLKFGCNSSEDYASFFMIDENTGEVSFKPQNEDVGIYQLKLTVKDDDEIDFMSEYNFTLEIKNVNDKPIFTKITTSQYIEEIKPGNTEITLTEKAFEDTLFIFTVHAKDEDFYITGHQEDITISIQPEDKFTVDIKQDLPEKLVEFSFLPTDTDVGTFTAHLIVSDLENKASTLRLNIEVINENDPPIFSNLFIDTQFINLPSIPPQTFDIDMLGNAYNATEKIPYELAIKYTDLDPNEELTFDIDIRNRTSSEQREMLDWKIIPGSVSTNETIGILEITLTPDLLAGAENELWLEISAEDKSKEKGLLTLRLSVDNKNDQPLKSNIEYKIKDADRKTKGKQNLTVSFEAAKTTDPDGDILLYFWDFDDSDDIHVDALGLNVNWTYTDEGKYNVTLTVDDGNGGSNKTTLEIQVTKPKIEESDVISEKDDLIQIYGVPAYYFAIINLCIIIILITLIYLTLRRKKDRKLEKEKEESQPEDVEQPKAMDQMVIPSQDQAMITQYQAYLQQLMQQYPAQYQQLLATQQFPYGYNQALLMQQLQAQPYTPTADVNVRGYTQVPIPPPSGQQITSTEDLQLSAQKPPSLEQPGKQPLLPTPKKLLEPELDDISKNTSERHPGTEQESTEPLPTENEKLDENSINELKCQSCGAVIKEDWVLCPECMEPLS